MPTKINATLAEGVASSGGTDIIIHGGTVDVNCSDFTLYALTTGNTTTFNEPVILTCTNTVWDDADSGWQCIPISEFKFPTM